MPTRCTLLSIAAAAAPPNSGMQAVVASSATAAAAAVADDDSCCRYHLLLAQSYSSQNQQETRKWNRHRLLFLQVAYFYFISLYALFSSFCLTFYRFGAKKSRSWSQGPRRRKERGKGY